MRMLLINNKKHRELDSAGNVLQRFHIGLVTMAYRRDIKEHLDIATIATYYTFA